MAARRPSRVVKAIEALPRRLADRSRRRLQEAGPAVVAAFRRHSPVKTGALRESWRFRTARHGGGGWKLTLHANFYWFYQNARGRNRGFARRAQQEARKVLRDTLFTFLPTSRPPRSR